jgi:hypothetical protein
MSKQTFVMTPKNYPRPLEVFGEHAAMRASSEAAIGSELFLKEGSPGSTSPWLARRQRSLPRRPSARRAQRKNCELLTAFLASCGRPELRTHEGAPARREFSCTSSQQV